MSTIIYIIVEGGHDHSRLEHYRHSVLVQTFISMRKTQHISEGTVEVSLETSLAHLHLTRCPSNVGMNCERRHPIAGRSSVRSRCSAALLSSKKLLDRNSDVFCDLSQECWSNVSTRVKRDRRAASIGMPVLLMRTTLSNFFQALLFKERCDLFGFQDRDVAHLTYLDRLNANELGL